MMGYFNYPFYCSGFSYLGIITWFLIVTLLSLGIAFFWKGLNKKEK